MVIHLQGLHCKEKQVGGIEEIAEVGRGEMIGCSKFIIGVLRQSGIADLRYFEWSLRI